MAGSGRPPSNHVIIPFTISRFGYRSHNPCVATQRQVAIDIMYEGGYYSAPQTREAFSLVFRTAD